MIDGVGKNLRTDLARAPVDQGAAAAKTAGVTATAKAPAVGAAVSEIAAAGPPVDADKVAAIRAAIAEGRYPVDPARIADRMIALDLPDLG
ncbi:MAG: flagellar biosynthesis anti-sigma factor FlgM [Allosphingosinicella sp.]